MKNRTFFIPLYLFVLALVFNACVPKERLIYMQGLPEQIELEAARYTPRLKADDLLFIHVGSINPEVAAPFNQSGGGGGNIQSNDLNTYLIDVDGYISFPVIGRVKLGGLTREEAASALERKLSYYLKNPTVTMRIKNMKFTVLGEVNNPGAYSINGERVTLLEALGMAGDLRLTGIRDNVLVIRDNGETKSSYRVDLTDPGLIDSPVYYLAQNDVVYVQPNQSQIDSTSRVYRNVPLFISITSLIITVVTLLTR